MNTINFCINFSSTIFLRILFLIFFIIYIIYQLRINNFILGIIDRIIIGIILLLIFLLITKGYDQNLITMLLSINGFFIAFLQYRKGREYEIIKEYITNKNKETDKVQRLEILLKSYVILSPILIDQKNLEIILRNELVESLIDEKNKNENINIFLKMIEIIGYKTLLNLLRKEKREKEISLKRIKKDEDKKFFNRNIEKINKAIEKLEDFVLPLKEENFIEKIKKWLKPQ